MSFVVNMKILLIQQNVGNVSSSVHNICFVNDMLICFR